MLGAGLYAELVAAGRLDGVARPYDDDEDAAAVDVGCLGAPIEPCVAYVSSCKFNRCLPLYLCRPLFDTDSRSPRPASTGSVRSASASSSGVMPKSLGSFLRVVVDVLRLDFEDDLDEDFPPNTFFIHDMLCGTNLCSALHRKCCAFVH